MEVVHNREQSRFEIKVGEHLSVADYRERGDVWIFTHTQVPDELRGQGIAARLVRAALEEAEAQNKQIVPECSYIAAYLERHKEFAALVWKRKDA